MSNPSSGNTQNGNLVHNPPSAHRTNVLTQRAGSLFEWVYFKGRVKEIVAALTGKPRTIPYLSDHDIDIAQVEVEKVGLRPIRLRQIVSTFGRMNYDKDFLPLQRRDKKRWMSVAIAMMSDAISLAPVAVIQVGNKHYTSDGNHRVSVARILNKLFVDTNVTRWHLRDR